MTRTAIHSGEHLAEQLKELGMSAAGLARRLDVPTNRVIAILNGQCGIPGDSALRLAHVFGTSPAFWLNLQNLYDLRLAEQKLGSVIRRLPRLQEREKSTPRNPHAPAARPSLRVFQYGNPQKVQRVPKQQNNNATSMSNGATIGYEVQLRQMADALRGSMDAAKLRFFPLVGSPH